MQTLLHVVEECVENEEDVAEPHLFQISKTLLAQVPVITNGQKKTMECQLDSAASCVMPCQD